VYLDKLHESFLLFVLCCLAIFILTQVRRRGQIVQALVSALPVIEYLNVIKNGFAGIFPGLEPLKVDHFVLDRTEECFCTGIIIAVTLTTHAANYTVPGKQGLIIFAAVLNSTV